jgi:hypothetical protein
MNKRMQLWLEILFMLGCLAILALALFKYPGFREMVRRSIGGMSIL